MQSAMASIISITSGKGGAGKSTVAVGLGVAFARRNRRAVIVELDFGLRGLDLMLGMENRVVYDLGDVLEGRCAPGDAVAAAEWNPPVFYLAAPARQPARFSQEQLRECVAALAEQYDVVLLDTPAGLGISRMTVQQMADTAVIVTTPDPVCIRDGARVAGMMEESGFSRYRLLINRVSRTAVRKSSIQDLDDVIDGVGAQLIGVLPEDAGLQSGQTRGLFPEESARISLIFSAISRRLEGEYVPLTIHRL